jgi:uncharacterized protein (TIGR00730 family)
MPKLLCVYCSSSRNLAPAYHEAAAAVGTGLAERGWGLVYGGGKVGLMGTLARAVKAAGGRVVGVIPEFMRDRELAYEGADEMVTVSSMAERKQAMIARAGGFLAIPGGVGTLDEIAEVLTLRVLGKVDRPAVFLNHDGYYDDLLRFFDRMIRERFLSEDLRGLYAVASTPFEIWPALESPPTLEVAPLWRPAGPAAR